MLWSQTSPSAWYADREARAEACEALRHRGLDRLEVHRHDPGRPAATGRSNISARTTHIQAALQAAPTLACTRLWTALEQQLAAVLPSKRRSRVTLDDRALPGVVPYGHRERDLARIFPALHHLRHARSRSWRTRCALRRASAPPRGPHARRRWRKPRWTRRPAPRVRSRCHLAPPLAHCRPDALTHWVPLFCIFSFEATMRPSPAGTSCSRPSSARIAPRSAPHQVSPPTRAACSAFSTAACRARPVSFEKARRTLAEILERRCLTRRLGCDAPPPPPPPPQRTPPPRPAPPASPRPAQVGNRGFEPSSVLRAHAKSPYKPESLWRTPRSPNRPGRAQAVSASCAARVSAAASATSSSAAALAVGWYPREYHPSEASETTEPIGDR